MDSPLYKTVSNLTNARICVCGDFMLDTYVRGRVGRVSPEGPIPVLHVDEKSHSPGGAGSVSIMLDALGSEVDCVGVIGADSGGKELKKQLIGAGCKVAGMIETNGRPTTLKTRYMGYVHSAGRGVQQMIRVDEESTTPLRRKVREKILNHISSVLPDIDLLLIQDMAKGTFTPSLLQEIIGECRSRGKPVLIDPSIKQEYAAYRHATCILPNRMETEKATGASMAYEKDYAEAAVGFVNSLDLDFSIITLDREGMFFADKDGQKALVPTTPRSVIDVTGAGDMVSATLAISLASKLPLKEAVRLANAAAGIEVSRQGAVPVTRTELAEGLRLHAEPCQNKIKTEEEAKQTVARIRARGESIAFTNGVFDILHLGHVELIRFAASRADNLIVGMNSDRSVRAYKGPGRPITPQQIRAQTLAAMPNIDYVIIFDNPSVYSLIEKLQPDVLVKGGDYSSKEEVVGWEIVEARGGKVVRAPHVKGYSTTELIQKIKDTTGNDEK